MIKKLILSAILLILLFANYSFNDENYYIQKPYKVKDFVIKNIDDEYFTLRKVSGPFKERNIVVFVFFATWCKPCKEEMPDIRALYRQFKNTNIKIVYVSLDEAKDEDKLKEFVKEKKLEIPMLHDSSSSLMQNVFNTKKRQIAIPAIAIMDKNQMIRARITGRKHNIQSIIKSITSKLNREQTKKIIPKANELEILFTSNQNGEHISCDCPTHPYGGFGRLITAFKELKDEREKVLFINAGDFFGIEPNRKLNSSIAKLMEVLPFDAVTFGDQEFFEGDDFIKKFAGKINAVTSNLYYKGKPMGKEYIVKKVNNITVGMIGLIHVESFLFFDESLIDDIEIIDPFKKANEIVNRLKNTVDVILVVSHMGIDYDRELAKKFSEIDLIFGSHSQTLTMKPEKVGDTLILHPGKKGERLGDIIVKVNRKKIQKVIDLTYVLLTSDYPDDMTVMNKYMDYLEKIN